MMVLLFLLLRSCFGLPKIDPAWIEANKQTLKEELISHRFGFVVGFPHAGTSLVRNSLEVHPDISTMHNTGLPEEEGELAQSVIGQWCDDSLHVTEKCAWATESNRIILYAEWRRFWNVSRPVLIEKTPMHSTKMRFLQFMFGAERSFFVGVLRHPLGTLRGALQYAPDEFKKQCFGPSIETWLTLSSFMLGDLSLIRNVVLVRFEDFVSGSISSHLNAVFRHIGLPPVDSAVVDLTVLPAADSNSRKRVRREYHGQQGKLTVNPMFAYSWISDFEALEQKMPEKCQEMKIKYESAVNKFGYSLLDFHKKVASTAVDPYIVTMP